MIQENTIDLKSKKEKRHFTKYINYLKKTIDKLDHLFNTSKITNPPEEVICLLHHYRVINIYYIIKLI